MARWVSLELFCTDARSHEPPARPRTTHFCPPSRRFLALSSGLLMACRPCWLSWMQECGPHARTEGRGGPQGPHRGQGSRRVALSDLQFDEVCRRLRVATHAHTHTHPHRLRDRGHPSSTRGRFIHPAPLLPPCDPAYSSSTYSSTYSCAHMRQKGLSGFTALCSSACLLLLLLLLGI